MFKRLLLPWFVCVCAAAPLFEENRGQTDAQIRFFGKAAGGQIFFTDSEVVLSSSVSEAPVRLRFANAAGPARWQPQSELAGLISYAIGNDRTKWVQGARQFERIAWRGVYPGVDAVFYWRGERVEYDLVLDPGADASRIRIQWLGAPARLEADGSIAVGEVRQLPPSIYQENKKVQGRFAAGPVAGEFGLSLGSYDRERPLVIDPVLTMASYIGGENDDAVVVVSDRFIAGNTASVQFPGTTAARRRSRDIFVRGTSSFTQSQGVFGTIVFGGSGDDELGGVASLPGSQAQLVLGGTTRSSDFPLSGFGLTQPARGASDGFLVWITASQNSGILFQFGTLVGGSGEDRVLAVASANNLLAFAGETDSLDLTPLGGPQTALGGGKDAFFGYGFSTGISRVGYLGGSGDDRATSVAVLSSASILIAGETRSPDFPLLQPDSVGRSGPSDGFLARLPAPVFTPDSPVSGAAWLLGGNGEDRVSALTPMRIPQFPPPGFAIVGATSSTDLPVRQAAQPTLAGETDMFAGVWWDGAISWLTYLGGSGAEEATGVAPNGAGDLFVSGWTRSTDIKTADALQSRSAGGEDAVLAVVNNRAVRHFTYYGGSGDDRARSIALMPEGVARLGGETTSADLPLKSPLQTARGTSKEGFVADIGSSYLIAPAELPLAKDGSAVLSVSAGQPSPGLSVTYKSADPAKVRIFDGIVSSGEVTAPLDEPVRLEGLADSGEVEVTTSAQGFSSAVVRVRLYPGALVASISGGTRLYTWSPPVSLSAAWSAIDPATLRPVPGTFYTSRSGLPAPSLRWTSSNQAVLQVASQQESIFESTKLVVAGPGESRIRLESNWPLFEPEGTLLTVERPAIRATRTLQLGKDLQDLLPLAIEPQSGVRRGILTARSEDPSRLLLSASALTLGEASASVPFASTPTSVPPGIWAQALADEGEVRVIVSSPELAQDVVVIVQLSPLRLEWGLRSSTSADILPSKTLAADSSDALQFQFRDPSGLGSPTIRPGAAFRLRVTNSADTVLELSRLSLQIPSFEPSQVFVRGLAPGAATLSLAVTPEVRLSTASVNVDVTPAAAAIFSNFPDSLTVGKDLQAGITFGATISSAGPIIVTSEDAAALLVSPSLTAEGLSTVTLPQNPFRDEYTFYVQALRSEGECNVIVKYPGGERRVRVVLVPSVFSFTPQSFPDQGFDQRFTLAAYAADEVTGALLASQLLRPGLRLEFSLRSEGAAVRLSRTSAVLQAVGSVNAIDVNLPPLGEEATLIAETGSSSARITLRRAPSQFQQPASVILFQDTVASYAFALVRTSVSTPMANVRLTSSDPSAVLLSISPDQPGAASVQLDVNERSTVYMHGLGGSGSAVLRLEAAGYQPVETVVVLRPLRLQFGLENFAAPPSVVVPAGKTVTGLAYLSAISSGAALRPGVAPIRVRLRSSDPAIAAIAPGEIEFSGTRTSVSITITARSAGEAGVLVEGDRVLSNPTPFTMIVRAPADVSPASYLLPLGGNLQTAIPVTAGSNPNGAAVTVSSSDPARLVVSRSAAAPGVGSVTAAIPPGEQQVPVYLQALSAEGEAIVTVKSPGIPDVRWRVQLEPGWLTPRVENSPLGLGQTTSLRAFAQQTSPPGQQVELRPGLGALRLPIVQSVPGIVEVAPELPIAAGEVSQASVQLRGTAAGDTFVSFIQPPGFGPVPAGSGRAAVRVAPNTIRLGCGNPIYLGRDTQATCTVFAPAGTVVQAVSSDPARLVLAAAPLSAGAARQTLTATNGEVQLTLQALASSGTVELILSAPGCEEVRIAVVLKRTQIGVTTPSVIVERGSTAPLTFYLAVTGSSGSATLAARAGSAIKLDLSAAPSGIVAFEPASRTFPAGESRVQTNIRGVSIGNAQLELTLPDGVTTLLGPLTLTVQ